MPTSPSRPAPVDELPAARDPDTRAEASLCQVTKDFPGVRAVDRIDLDVVAGDMVALLGPSGCGKTTTLRMLGGFENPTSGRVLLRGEDVTDRPPNRRNTAMVFQSYALFPHLSVADNVGYGLRRRGLGRPDVRDRVRRMLERLELTRFADRKPAALSGGQRQRVAVGRALVMEPALLLLDEPFSALDAQLREQTRVGLRRLQQETRTSAVFVTHDQEEALAISDRVVVMNDGRVEQIGTPQQVYEQPASRFVAAFLGAANLLTATVTDRGGDHLTTRTDTGLELHATPPSAAARPRPGTSATFMLRPEDLVVGPDQPHPGDVTFVSYLGNTAEMRVRLTTGEELSVRGPRALAGHRPGTSVRVGWPAGAARMLPQ